MDVKNRDSGRMTIGKIKTLLETFPKVNTEICIILSQSILEKIKENQIESHPDDFEVFRLRSDIHVIDDKDGKEIICLELFEKS